MLGEWLFRSFESVFELVRGLRDSQTSINNKDLGLLVKKDAENICKDNIWSSFLCVLALSSVICWPIHLFYASCGFQKYQKMFNQKIYPRERCDSNKCFVLVWTCLYKKANHRSLNNHFVPLLKLLMSTENKWKHGHREKVGSLSKVQKKVDNFFLKEFRNNTETTEQEQNISISLKKKYLLNPLLLKTLQPTQWLKTKSLFHILNSNKLNQQR